MSTRKIIIGALTVCLVVLSAYSSQAAAEPAGKKTKESAKSKGKEGGSFKSMLGGEENGKEPLYIKSNSLSLDTKIRTFRYTGNVEITRGAVVITADVVIGKYDEKNQLQTVICEDNVVVTNGETMRASSNHAVYDLRTATIEMTEGPELSREGNVLSADKVKVYVNEDRSEAEGNVRVKVIKADEGTGGTATKTKLQALSKGKAEPTETEAEKAAADDEDKADE